jgi:predicted ester cyclase/heme-degrading monooxygenase HmoA
MKSTHTRIHMLLAILLIPAVSSAQSANNINKSTKNKEVIMSATQHNKEVVRKLYEQSLNKRNLELLRDLVSEDYVGVRGIKGAAGFQEPVVPVIKGFPDIQWTIEELLGEGDKVFVKWKLQGTHTGQWQHYAITGKTITNEGMAVFELKDGKIINGKVLTDRLDFLQQLGALPQDLTQLSNRQPSGNQVNFIDKFLVPAKAKQEFLERVKINRNFIKNLPGFIKDAAYERTDENGNLVFITIAVWESEDAVKKAKEAVQAEYQKQGFNMPEMLERLNITMDRGVYREEMAQ